jgi:hypothetical protein
VTTQLLLVIIIIPELWYIAMGWKISDRVKRSTQRQTRRPIQCVFGIFPGGKAART